MILLAVCLAFLGKPDVIKAEIMERSEDCEVNVSYHYMIVPGTKEWLQLDGAVEKRKVCKVPENTMEHMSTDLSWILF